MNLALDVGSVGSLVVESRSQTMPASYARILPSSRRLYRAPTGGVLRGFTTTLLTPFNWGWAVVRRAFSSVESSEPLGREGKPLDFCDHDYISSARCDGESGFAQLPTAQPTSHPVCADFHRCVGQVTIDRRVAGKFVRSV